MGGTVTINELLQGNVALDVQCLDRVCLHGHVPNLQVTAQVVPFMTRHLGLPMPSPAVMEKIGTRFRLLGVPYPVNQMSYDLSRLRVNRLIERRPRTTFDLTPDGQRVAIFYTKVDDRLLRPLIAADAPPAPKRTAPSTNHRSTRPRLRRHRLGAAA
jgi:hypothetical protein